MNLYFEKLRAEDELMSFEKIDKFSEEELNRVCFARGIEIEGTTYEEKMKDLKLWLAISNLRNAPHSLLLYTRIIDITQDMYEITDDEDEFEVLKRVLHYSLILCIGAKRDLLHRKTQSIREDIWY